jgi:hypothetical protein
MKKQVSKNKGVSKVLIYPLAPQGGNYKYLYIKKSLLGDLGVKTKKRAFETPSLMSFLFISLTLLSSCKSSHSQNRLIPTKDLVDVLTELYVADGLLSLPPVHFKFAAKDSTSNYVDIIQRHGYTKERMDYTMRYYFEKKPKKLENIYDQVLTRLSEKQALLEKEVPPAPVVLFNLWKGPGSFEVPETGTKNPAWFNVPIKDTGNFMLSFTAIVFPDDQSLNPRVTVFFWHTDSSKTEFKINWPETKLPKDGKMHSYSLNKRNSNPAMTHISGWLLDSDPKEGRWIKHAKIVNITLRKGLEE